MESCSVPEEVLITKGINVEQRNVEELYGPWMQVVSKRRRNVDVQGSSGLNHMTTKKTKIMGSRFFVIAVEREEVTEWEDEVMIVEHVAREVVVKDSGVMVP
ncbi:hypothetical protein V6N13_043362 [Hibiscus sabdariffa]